MEVQSTSSDSTQSDLSKAEIERYSRQLLLPEVSVSGQQKLKNASVLCIGAGGLGSPLAMYLAGAGVGRIGLVDFDDVDVSNLHRQIIHGTKDIGRPKLQSAKERIEDLNPHVRIDLYEGPLMSENALEILRPYDVVVDGTDNFHTRYLVNDACTLLGKPNVYGSVFRFDGQVSVFWAEKGPCYRCLYPEPPPAGIFPNCAEGGVLGVLPGIVGVLQATEAIKLILGIGDSLVGRLKLFDALSMEFKEVKLRKNLGCPCCGENRTMVGLQEYAQICHKPASTTDVLAADGESEITPRTLSDRIGQGAEIFIVDVRDPHEFQICQIPGARLMPLGQLESRLSELNGHRDIVVYCRSGVRSAKAAKLLRDAGYSKAKSLAGGILEWAAKVDPSIPKY